MKKLIRHKLWKWLSLGLLLSIPSIVQGQDAVEIVEAVTEAVEEAAPVISGADAKFIVDNLWILIAAALVFIMHLGFATVESGLTRSKNTVNVLFKNVFVICMGPLTYALCGFNAI